MAKRQTMATLLPGDVVTLRHDGATFLARFEGKVGTPDDERLRFMALDDGIDDYTFEVYRFHGRWAAGTGATQISVARQ